MADVHKASWAEMEAAAGQYWRKQTISIHGFTGILIVKVSSSDYSAHIDGGLPGYEHLVARLVLVVY